MEARSGAMKHRQDWSGASALNERPPNIAMEPTARTCRWRAAAHRERCLGNFRFATDDDLNWDTGMAQHGDQGIDTEAVDLASDKVADPWLSHFKQACGLSLREPPSLNQLADPNHQVRANLEVLRFFL